MAISAQRPTATAANGRRSERSAIAAQWLACTFPCRRFDAALADCLARLGADAVCYSFIVADFHRLLLAGFAGAPVCKIFAPRGFGEKTRSFERLSVRTPPVPTVQVRSDDAPEISFAAPSWESPAATPTSRSAS